MSESKDVTSGVLNQDGPKVDGQSYPGRPTPPVQKVVDAKEELGTALRLSKTQTGENRAAINSHEEKNKTHGPKRMKTIFTRLRSFLKSLMWSGF